MSGPTDRIPVLPGDDDRRRTLVDAALGALPTALAVALGAVPIALLIVESVSPPVTPSNYAAVADSVYPAVMLRSLGIGAVITAVCLAIAYPVTYWLAHVCPARYRLPLLISLTLPLWLNYVVLNYTWVWILAADGIVNTALTGSGLVGQPLELLRTPSGIGVGPIELPGPSLGIGFVHIYLPYVLLTMYVSMERLDYRQVEAARDLGAGGVRVFLDIVVPETYAGAVAGTLIVYARIAGAFATPQILGSPSEQMIAQTITTQFYDVLDYPFAAALSVVFLVVVVVGFGVGALSTDVRAELKRW
ncbi:ABC transporter permease [Halobellus ruber]|uniref:ABC transporter permease n=1 Tax=Halobellus ruber TaxID=2761102 RepID=A0A7J9SK10_9EURY|nr:ABC transporter permease [Halobellus ruber]MBB6647284.1 ABC transporter permease [Halobellus ruber]